MRTKKIICGFFLSLMLGIAGMLFSACGEDLPVKILKVTGFESEVVVGAEYNYDNFSAVLKMESGEEVTVTAEDLEIEVVDTSTIGTKTIAVKYKYADDKYLSVAIEIEVTNDYVVGIYSLSGLQATARVHSIYNYDNVSAVVVYKSGETRTINANSLTVSQINTNEGCESEQTITVSYTQAGITVNKTFAVNVIPDTPTEIANVAGYQEEVEFGTDFNYDNISFVVSYASNNYTKTVNKNTQGFNIDLSNFNKNEVGTYNISVSYAEAGQTVSKVFEVAVAKDIPVEFVSFTKNSVENGSEFTTNAVINTKFHQNVDVSASQLDFDLTNLNTNEDGEYEITISYSNNGTTISEHLTVLVYSEDRIISISECQDFITKIALDEEYTIPQTAYANILRASGVDKVYASLLDIDYTAVNVHQVGLYDVNVSYTEEGVDKNGDDYSDTINKSFKVEVCDYITQTVISGTYANKLAYGRSYDKSGISLTLTYKSGAVDTITSDELDIEIANNVLGEQTLTITSQNDFYKSNALAYGKISASTSVVVYDYVTDYAITGTYAQEVEIEADYVITGITLTLYYASGANEVVANNLLTISIKNDEYELEDNLSVEYLLDKSKTQGQTTDFDIKLYKTIVVNERAENFEVLGFDKPTFVSLYETNSQSQNEYTATGSSANKGFKVIGNKYVVGDDNDFVFSPMLTIYKDNDSDVITEYNARFTVYIYENDSYIELKKESTNSSDKLLADYVKIDTYYHTLDFTELAVGESFKISVVPKLALNSTPIVFEFDVIDGYNIYNAADLSVIDNANLGGKWTDIKTANGIDLDLNVNAVIMHNNILIEKEDIPERHFWKSEEVLGASDYDRVLGSLKDSSEDELGMIYWHTVSDGSTFRFEGNYFTLSVQNIPMVVRERNQSVSVEDEAITVHTTLFNFAGNSSGNGSLIAKYELNNIAMFGNAKKTENTIASGGIISFKKENSILEAYNLCSQCWFIALFQNEGVRNLNYDQDDIYMKVKSCTAFDSYNTLIYNWGGTLFIEDSILIGAGGPVMICDHTGHNNDGSGGTISKVITKNSILESWVAGSEGWFQTYQATELATLIKSLDVLFKQQSKTILDEAGSGNKINIIAVYKSAEAQGITNQKISGQFESIDCEYDLDVLYGKLNTILNNMVLASLITEQQASRVYSNAQNIDIDMDISSVGLNYCLNDLVDKGFLDADDAEDMYNAVMGANQSVSQSYMRQVLDFLVAQSWLSETEAGLLLNYAIVCTMNYAKQELSAVLNNIVLAEYLTQDEANAIYRLAVNKKMDLDKKDINIYFSIMVALNLLTQSQAEQILAQAIGAQVDNGAFGFAGTDGWIINPQNTNTLTTDTFANGYKNMYMYLPNGMGVVFGTQNYTAA